jgi:hypothetical protein
LNISPARVGKANRTFVDLKRHAKRPLGTVPIEKISANDLLSGQAAEARKI